MILSHSRVNKYDFCPRAYHYYYVEGWQPALKRPPLLFGGAVDTALTALFKNGEDPLNVFESAWLSYKDSPIEWGKRNTWESFLEMGKKILERFVAEEAPRFTDISPENVQRRLEADIDGLGVAGYPDLYGRVDGLLTLTDFKVVQSPYEPEEVQLNEQLTAYWWLTGTNGFHVERVAFCLLLKLKEPRIEWYFATRSQEDVAEYQEKLKIIAADIERGRFPRKSSSCGFMGGCDYIPLCVGNEARIRETLILKDEIPEEDLII